MLECSLEIVELLGGEEGSDGEFIRDSLHVFYKKNRERLSRMYRNLQCHCTVLLAIAEL